MSRSTMPTQFLNTSRNGDSTTSLGRCLDPISGRFRYYPKDEIKMQTESDAVQPCKLYFGEPVIRGLAGAAAGGGNEKERKE